MSMPVESVLESLYRVITNVVSDYINLLVAHTICNHPLSYQFYMPLLKIVFKEITGFRNCSIKCPCFLTLRSRSVNRDKIRNHSSYSFPSRNWIIKTVKTNSMVNINISLNLLLCSPEMLWEETCRTFRCAYVWLNVHITALQEHVYKVKLSLCFNWAPRHGGVLVEWRYSSTHSLTSALDGGEWSTSRRCE
jgi:hypothetical protein